MSDSKTDMITLATDEPTILPMYVECKFTVENDEGNGGDFEKNTGGSRRRRRVTFEGYATDELYAALTDAVREVVDDGR